MCLPYTARSLDWESLNSSLSKPTHTIYLKSFFCRDSFHIFQRVLYHYT